MNVSIEYEDPKYNEIVSGDTWIEVVRQIGNTAIKLTVLPDDADYPRPDFPRYVVVYGHSCIRLESVRGNMATYYRDAGHWWANARFVDGKLKFTEAYGDHHPVPTDYVCNGEAITKERWVDDNRGYI